MKSFKHYNVELHFNFSESDNNPTNIYDNLKSVLLDQLKLFL